MTETAYERVLYALRGHGCKVVESGGKASSTCPHHEDRNPSVSVTPGYERVLIHCHAGCDNTDVVGALGLTMADLYDERGATYNYDDGRVVRRSYDERGKKKFVQTGAAETSTLYHAGLLAGADPDAGVFLVEGEADVHTIEMAGGVAVTAPQGANSFSKVDVGPLAGRWVTVVVDADEAGDKWAGQVAAKLDGVADGYRFVHARTGKDASDHIAAGHGLTDFVAYDPPGVTRAAHIKLSKAVTGRMAGVRWMYRGRIPVGMVTLLAGREGIGKSTVSLDFAARITRGTLPGRYEGKPRAVIVCATEDSWNHTILPRLRAVGADLNLIYNVEVQEPTGVKRSIVAPADVARMRAAFRRVKPVLLIIDPLMAVMDGKVDTHKQAEVQQALEPLVRMCEHLAMSVLALIHVNKGATTDPLNNIMGSKAFATLPRSILYCLEEDDGQFMLCHVKCNVGPKMASIGYRLQPVRFDLPPEQVEEGDDPYIESSRVVWGDEDPRTAGEMLEEAAGGANLGDAAQAVLNIIDGEPGVVTTAHLHDKLSHLDERALDNALSRLAKKGRIARVKRGVYQSTKLTPPWP